MCKFTVQWLCYPRHILFRLLLMSRYKVFKGCVEKENWYNEIAFSEYVNTIINILIKTYPNATTELNYQNTYTFVIAVLLSAQATDKSVNKATSELFKIANNPAKDIRRKIS